MKKLLCLTLVIILSFQLSACSLLTPIPDETPDIIPERTLFPCEDCHAEAEIGDDWIPVWCDEFEGDSIDSSKWNISDLASPWNDEAQYYSPNNLFIDDGKLVIEARKESFGGRIYTSGRLHTQYKGDWLYGRLIVRAKLPSGRGNWAGIWMSSTEDVYGYWPQSGEIDIMEYVGREQNKIYGNFHTGKYNWMLENHIGNSVMIENVEEKFVNYEMIWEPTIIKLYVDGEFIVAYENTAREFIDNFQKAKSQDKTWPFDQTFFLILCLAIGGWGAVEGIDDDAFPMRFEIDYVRYYQRDYPYIDTQKPSSIDAVIMGQSIFKSMIVWDIPDDNYGIDHYEIYINDQFLGTSKVNAYMITGHSPRTIYDLNVIAVDFAGNKSEPIPIEFSYG